MWSVPNALLASIATKLVLQRLQVHVLLDISA
jgi:hypothetical protein